MKLLNRLLVCADLASLSLGWAGCATHKTVAPLSNGYEEVSHPSHTLIDEPPPPRIALQRREPDGTVTSIWPALSSADTVIKGDLVLFAAEKAYTEPERTTRARLFAARPRELPLDLTDEVLWRWSKANGRDFGTTLQKFASIAPQASGEAVEVHLQFWAGPEYGETHEDWPDNGSLLLSWPQIDEIVHAVKTKGVTEKDLRWHTEYIGEKF
ncbi:MAG: hypothetical protein ABSH48_05370 [Verrucomicrobiota bacterium]